MHKSNKRGIEVAYVVDEVVSYLHVYMISFTMLCEVEPNTFLRSINVMVSGRLIMRAWSMIDDRVNICSMAPLTLDGNPFWIGGLMTPFARQFFKPPG